MHIFREKEKVINHKAVYGLVSIDRKILTISNKKRFCLPCGGIENAESHFECLKREFLEEAGYKVDIESYLGCAKVL